MREMIRFLTKMPGRIFGSIKKNRKAWIVFTVATGLLISFFPAVFFKLNRVFFCVDGDGLLGYYNFLYRIKYDTDFFLQQSINYPFGENILFTGCHVPLSTLIKIFSYVIDVSGYSVGILNFVMLISIPLCAVFIFLILDRLKVHFVYALLASVSIAFLSPQLIRIGGHFTLSYHFFIPCFLYLLFRFHEENKIRISILISLLVLASAATHLYFLAFLLVTGIVYFAVYVLSDIRNLQRWKSGGINFSIQFVLPYFLLKGIEYLANYNQTRTKFPWGVMEALSNWDGIFFPYGRPYEKYYYSFYKPIGVSWEGMAFLGIFTSFIVLIIALTLVKNILNKDAKRFFAVTDNRFLNILFFASLLSLFISFGTLFKWDPSLFYKIGVLRQFRGMGRFTWSFFYIANIIAVYWLWKYSVNWKRIPRHIVMSLSVLIMAFDAYVFVRDYEKGINNTIPEFMDARNRLSDNRWFSDDLKKKYQAIIPLPYFNLGSDNLGIYTQSKIIQYAYLVSLKTGLPLFAVNSTRVPIDQALKSIILFLEPYAECDIWSGFNRKPFLLVVKKDELNANEKRILSAAVFLKKTSTYSVYEITPEQLKAQHMDYIRNARKLPDMDELYAKNGFYCSDSTAGFYYNSYKNAPAGVAENGAHEFTVFYEDTIPYNKSYKSYTFSCWIYDIGKDLVPRSTIEVIQWDSAGNYYETQRYSPAMLIKLSDGHKALIEGSLKVKNRNDNIKIAMWNYELQKEDKLRYNSFLLKPDSVDIYNFGKGNIFRNNRTYIFPERQTKSSSNETATKNSGRR